MSLPDGLVGNDNLGPLLLAQHLGGGVELAGDDLESLVGLTLLCICKSSGVSGGSMSRIYPDDPHAGRKTGTRVGMTYLQGLTNAVDDRETTVNGGLGLAGNEL